MKIFSKEALTATGAMMIIIVMLSGIFFNWKAAGSGFIQEYRTSLPEQHDIFDYAETAARSVEKGVQEGIIGKPFYLNVFGLIQKTLDKKMLSDVNYGALYKTKYNQITFAVGQKNVDASLAEIGRLKTDLDKLGIPLLYVQAPFKILGDEKQLPPAVYDYADDNADLFLAGLDAKGIDYLDLRESLLNSGMTQNEMFFNTDHHWTIDSAFFSFGQICNELNKDYGFSIDSFYTDIKNYKKTKYEDFFIGSMGRRVGKVYGGIDDFTLITPDFDTDLELFEDFKTTYTGTFEEAVLVKSYIDPKAPPETNRYAVYHGDNAELVFTNKKVDKGDILIIKDSFALPVYSFLSLANHKVRALDMRLYNSPVTKCAEAYKPEVVIVMYNADSFNDVVFNFYQGE